MKSRIMKLTLSTEVVAMSLALIGVGLNFALVSAWGTFPVEFRNFFQMGQLGHRLLGYSALVGMVGVILTIANLGIGNRSFKWLRILAVVGFIFLVPFLGLAE